MTRAAILDALEADGPMTISALSERISLGRSYTREAVRRLCQRGLVKVVGEATVPAGEGSACAFVYAVIPKPVVITRDEQEDPLVSTPVVKATVPAPAQADDIRAVLSKQPALVEVWKC